jgi:hypothetical protein
MKKSLMLALVLVVCAMTAAAQFRTPKEDSRISESLIQAPSSSFLFGWFDPTRFSMHHSLSYTYLSSGGEGMSLGTYTNSMQYRFADNLNAAADVSLSYMPTGSFMGSGKNDLSKIYLSRAQLDYHPWENMSIQLQYRALPASSFFSPWYSPWYRDNGY